MKAALAIVTLFVTIIALNATVVRKFPGDHNQRHIYNYEIDSDVEQMPRSEFFGNDDIESNYYYNKFNKFNNYQNDWSFESEEVSSNEESSEQYKHINNVEPFHPGTLSSDIVEKISTIDKIIAKEQRFTNNVGVHYLKNPLSVRNVYIKNTPQQIASLKNATIKNIDNGQMTYVVIDLERDTLFAQYNFNQLNAAGLFKMDTTSNTYKGDFVMSLYKVRSNVTEKLNDQMITYSPARFEYSDVAAFDQAGNEVESIYEPLNKRYSSVLESAIADEVANSLRKGLLLNLKSEINTPTHYIKTGQFNKLFDLKWQEKFDTLEMGNIGGSSVSWDAEGRPVKLFSYTRVDSKTYKLRFTTVLKNLQWTGDLKALLAGEKLAVYKSSSFKVKTVRTNVTILKNIDDQQCKKINVDVKLDGFEYLPNGEVPSPAFLVASHQLPRFIEHNFEAAMEKTLEKELCSGKFY